MSTIIIDCETAPLSEEEQQPYEPQFEPSAKLTPPEAARLPSSFSHGSLKDPGKLAAWQDKKAEEHAAEQLERMRRRANDVFAKRAAWLDGAQLDAMRCKICAVGILSAAGTAILLGVGGGIYGEMSEREIISETWARIDSTYQGKRQFVAGHNLTGYDLPMLEQRSIILGIPIPRGIRARNRKFYNTDKFIDTLELWPKKLDLIGKALGIGGKVNANGISGKDFWRAPEATQRAYLEQDLQICAEIVKRFGGEGAE